MHNATATFHVVCRRRCRPQADNEHRRGIARCIVSSAVAGPRPVGRAMSALGSFSTEFSEAYLSTGVCFTPKADVRLNSVCR